MTAPQTVADVLGRCDCGRPFESIYSAFTHECRECEDFREAEGILQAQMLEHGFPGAAATSARQGESHD